MQTHVQKWGNSLGVRIPKDLAKQLHIDSGSSITLYVEDGRLIIQTQKYDLDSLLKDITPYNQHRPLMEDKPRGNEEW